MLTDMQILKIKNAVMRVLHVPGNDTGGNLEMAVAVDYDIPTAELKEDCAKIAAALKRQDEVFRNVRLNLIRWVSDEVILKEVSSLSVLQMGTAFSKTDNGTTCGGQAECAKKKEPKSIDELLRQMKLFYARSKVILLLTDGNYIVKDEKAVSEALNPFLKRKLVLIERGEKEENAEKLKELRNKIVI